MKKEVSVLGIDLAKSSFSLHGIDQEGRKIVSRKVSRYELIQEVEQISPHLVAMEACGGAHHFGRILEGKGFAVKMMAPARVVAYRSSGKKNDAVDAAAIAEAGARANVPTITVKSTWQQDLASLQRLRTLQVRQRTALSNQIRGLLMEYGVVLSQGHAALREKLSALLNGQEDAPSLSACLREELSTVQQQLRALEQEIDRLERRIISLLGDHEIAQRLQTVPGVGPLTAAAVLSTVANPSDFKSGRALSAYLGIVPRQHSTGGKTTLLGISKHGPKELRCLLIHGARSALNTLDKRADQGEPLALWAKRLRDTKGYNKAAVALANKTARILWALWCKGGTYNQSLCCRPLTNKQTKVQGDRYVAEERKERPGND